MIVKMSYTFKREKLGHNVYFSSVTDEKFKFDKISVCLILPTDRESVTVNALVPSLLRRSCEEYPDFTALNKKLGSLYGAVLDADVSKYGGHQALNVTVQGIDDRFSLENEKLSEEYAKLLCSMLFSPDVKDGEFNAEAVKIEKQSLKDLIESEVNEKRYYAISQCMQSMFAPSAFSVKKYGYADEVDAITPKDAFEAYEKIIDRAAVEIIYAGSGNPECAKRVFADIFKGKERNSIPFEAAKAPEQKNNALEIAEEMDVNQGKLVMGFRLPAIKTKRERDAVRVMIAMLGGTTSSKLFLNVREKLSLCYYCAARYDKLSSGVVIDSGIEFENKEKAQSEILKQIEDIKNGVFTDEELSQTILFVRNAMKSISDSPSALTSWYLGQILSGDIKSPAEDSEDIEKITADEVKKAASLLLLDTVYFLKGKEQE